MTTVENWGVSRHAFNTGAVYGRSMQIIVKISIQSAARQNLILALGPPLAQSDSRSIKFSLVQVTENAKATLDELIADNCKAPCFELAGYKSLEIEQGDYILVGHCHASSNCRDEQFELTVFSKQQATIESLPLYSTGDIVDRYSPNKYGLLFHEDLYFKHDKLHLSLRLDLRSYASCAQEQK